jgi:hypothetical protein
MLQGAGPNPIMQSVASMKEGRQIVEKSRNTKMDLQPCSPATFVMTQNVNAFQDVALSQPFSNTNPERLHCSLVWD